MAVLLGCVLLMVALILPALRVNAAEGDVCPPLDSGKIDVSGEQTSITVTAPAGFLIDAYCVKAGSTQGGTGGPVIVPVDPPQKSVTITYPSGKAISHYSVSYVPISTPTTPPPTTTTKPPTSTTTTKTTTHTSGTSSSTHPSSSSTSSGAAAVTTYPLQPVSAGATSDTGSGVTPVQAGLLGAALLGLLALVTGGRLPRVLRRGSRSE
jgi:hypothetical protein